MNRNNLLEYVKGAQGMAFEWGQMDCTIYPLRCFDALTGSNIADPIVGKWSSLLSAVRYGRDTGQTLEQYLIDAGCIEIPHNFQQTGDFLMLDVESVNGHDWRSAAVCLGRISSCCTFDGVVTVRTDSLNISKVLGVR